jgi:mRNA interferase MazF
MERGDVYLVDLEPSRGSEANKLRPAILVSNDAANRTAERNRRGVLTVVPVTSNASRIFPFQILLTAGDGGLAVESKAQAEQIRSVDYTRLRQRIGAVHKDTLRQLDTALRIHLAL